MGKTCSTFTGKSHVINDNVCGLCHHRGNDAPCIGFSLCLGNNDVQNNLGILLRKNGNTVGDKVRVREDLEADNWYGKEIFVSGMECLKGKIVTISKIAGEKYEIIEDPKRYWWTDC